jgi:hypothetical protein
VRTHPVGEPAHEGAAGGNLVEADIFVRFVGLGDAAGDVDDAGHTGVTLEQGGLGAERDLGVAVLAGQRLGERHRLTVRAHVQPPIIDALLECYAGVWMDRLHARLQFGKAALDYLQRGC